MSLIELIMKDIDNGHIGYERDDFSQNFDLLQRGFILRVLEKHLKQSENKSIYDLIEKYKTLIKKSGEGSIIGKILTIVISDLETLKQSEKADQYDLGFERGKQIGYKEGWKAKSEHKPVSVYCDGCKEYVYVPHTCGSIGQYSHG